MKKMVRLRHDVTFTNLEKVFWTKEGYTKGDVINYYLAIAKVILPHLQDRPMVLNRHPNGIEGESFFQKQVTLSQTPPWVKTAKVQHTKKVNDYLLVQDVETLLYVANLGCIELNPFHSRVKNLSNPDYMVLDLDPEDISFRHVVEVALSIHELLENIGVKNYCKTSGGRGLHIYVPLGAKYSFEQSEDFAKLIGTVMEKLHPKLVSLIRSPSKRQGKVYIDFLRNSRHQTLASAYCLRPRKHAPASTPLLWEEVKPDLNPLEFNIETLPRRIKEKGDLFKAVLGKGIDMNKSIHKLQGLYPR